MKQSYIIGIFMLYIAILGIEMNISGHNTLATSFTNLQQPLTWFAMGTTGDWLTAGYTVVLHAGEFLLNLLYVFLLWSPTIFAGDAVWYWWIVCLPIDVGMVVGIVLSIRGVSST